MILKLFVVISVGLTCVAGICGPPPLIPPHYEEWGCTPHKEPVCNHVTHFTCPDWNTWDKTKCHFKGKTYELGETLHSIEGDPCLRECVCTAEEKDELPEFKCTHPFCTEYLRISLPQQSGCIGQYSADQCCVQKNVCGAEVDALHKCSFRGKDYYKHQHIKSEQYLDKCYTCLCDEHFNHSSNFDLSQSKQCKKIECAIELHHLKEAQKGCAPIYLDKNCCPISWKCPSGDEKIKETSIPSDPNLTCKFGKLTVNRFQEIESDDQCVTCQCANPPFISCTHKEDCYNI